MELNVRLSMDNVEEKETVFPKWKCLPVAIFLPQSTYEINTYLSKVPARFHLSMFVEDGQPYSALGMRTLGLYL